MNIEIYIVALAQAEELISQLLIKEFEAGNSLCKTLYKTRIKPHINILKKDSWLVAETNYVDKTYRNSFYNYYSSKSNSYKKNCIRISIFKDNLEYSDFRNPKKEKELHNRYRGFFILRPTCPNFIGRSIISPEAINNNNFSCCTSNFKTTCNGLKFSIDGFPHATQDNETITCAETSLWAIMEYFGNKYSEYCPALPSTIIKTLNHLSYERQIPSKGLRIEHISYALKQFGFGTRLYSRKNFNTQFDQLLSCYVESGVPLIIGIDNEHINGSIRHALLVVGHEDITEDQIDKVYSRTLNPTMTNDQKKLLNTKKINIYDYDSIRKKFIFIDDNHPVYQKATLKDPAKHYEDEEWKKCKITHFIVPLYPRIYLEALEAKAYATDFLIRYHTKQSTPTDYVLRVFLASTRSYKAKLALNTSFDPKPKALILEKPMAKFVWVAELSDKELIKDRKAKGLILLDATEANIHNHKPLIMAFIQGKMFSLEKISGILDNSSLDLSPFFIYDHNLKPYNS